MQNHPSQPFKIMNAMLLASLALLHLGAYAGSFRVVVCAPPNQTSLLEITSDGELNLLAVNEDGHPIGMVQENWGDEIEESALDNEFIVYRASDGVILARASANEGHLQLRGHLLQWTGEIQEVPGYPELAIESNGTRVAMLDPHGNLWITGQKDCGCQHDGERDNGSLIGAVSLPDPGIGYYQFRSGDVKDTDDWSCSCTVINAIVNVGINWGRTPFIGIGDLSQGPSGGSFPPHSSHQNGLDIDIRYVRSDNKPSVMLDPETLNNSWEYGYTFGLHDASTFDRQATIDLMELFFIEGADKIYVDDRAGIHTHDFPDYLRARGIVVESLPSHQHHFHVRFPQSFPWPGY
jgi:hypothetical protein